MRTGGLFAAGLSVIPCFFFWVGLGLQLGREGNSPTGGTGDETYRRPLCTGDSIRVGIADHGRFARNGPARNCRVLDRYKAEDRLPVPRDRIDRRELCRGAATTTDDSTE